MIYYHDFCLYFESPSSLKYYKIYTYISSWFCSVLTSKSLIHVEFILVFEMIQVFKFILFQIFSYLS